MRKDRADRLKARETRVLELIQSGLDATTIAERLGIQRDSVITILKRNGYQWLRKGKEWRKT